jgi:hypothetical protein
MPLYVVPVRRAGFCLHGEAGTSETMAEQDGVLIGLLAARDDRDRAESLAERLPRTLRERIGEHTSWRTEICEAGAADAAAGPSELTESVRRRLLARGWQMGIGLTALPLRDGRQPVVAYASASHGVGLVSIPALGAVHTDERLHDAAAQLVEGLLGEPTAGDAHGSGARMRRRSAELASPIDIADAERNGSLRFTGAVVRSNLRVLAGMIRANRPMLVMARLSRSATAALGTGAYALTSANIWMVAHQSTWPRLVAVGVLATLMILISLSVAHGLWERAPDATARERVVLFNIVTLATLAIGIAALYLALFVILAVGAAVTIPPETLEQQIKDTPTAGEYAGLAWFAASVATVGGALGSLVESDEAVRDAAYRRRAGADATEASGADDRKD